MSGKHHTLDEWKSDLIGKEFNWLTVVDVIVDESDNSMKCICKCRCGNIKLIPPCIVSKSKAKSCGCFTKSAEYKLIMSTKSKEWCKNNHDKIKEIATKNSQYYKEHPDKRFEVGKRTSNWAKNNPDKIRDKAEKYSQWCKNNPDKVKERSKKYKQWYDNNQDAVEKMHNNQRMVYTNNPDLAKERGKKYSQWCINNPDRVKAQVDKFKQWCKDNPDRLKEAAAKRIQTFKNNPDIIKSLVSKRLNTLKDCPEIHITIKKNQQKSWKRKRSLSLESAAKELLDIVEPSFIERLVAGDISANDIISTKCPKCGRYSEHRFHNIFIWTKDRFKFDRYPLCRDCFANLTSSKAEQEIADYISTFYSGELVKNDRSIISPLELDLYYPEKRIAVEFNGDYWHNENHKSKDYHLNKYLKCRERGILLVSIFESDWSINKEDIKYYLKDLFDGKDNKLSFNDNHSLMNNNYPSMSVRCKCDKFIEDYYLYQNYRVYTCGYSNISLNTYFTGD